MSLGFFFDLNLQSALFPNCSTSRIKENLTQGFRSSLEPNLLAELCRFLLRVWDPRSAYRETPIPDAGCGHKCGIGDDGVVEIER